MSTQALREVATGAPKEQDPTRRLFNILDNKRGEIATLLPKDMDVMRFIGVVKTAILNTPAIVEADHLTLFTACMKAAQDGLLPDGKEAVLNVYNTKIKGKDGQPDRWVKKVQYLPMVGGLVKKLWGSGQVTYVDAAAVYERDVFEYIRGDESKIVHKPFLGADPGEITCAYIVVKLKNGETKREVMPRRDIDKVRAASKSADSGPWVTWYDQMAVKSVIKRGVKQLQLTPEIERVIANDNEATGFADTVAQIAPATPALENAPSPDASTITGTTVERQQDSIETADLPETGADSFVADMEAAEKAEKK